MITDFTSLRNAIAKHGPPLLLFSGGLDGAYLIATLGCTDLVALTVSLGGDDNEDSAQAVCRQAGVHHQMVDGRETFVSDYVFPAIKAQAIYGGTHPICASLSRPLLAEIAIEKAMALDCGVIIHTSNPSQNSLRRFNGAIRQCPLGFAGEFGSPFAEAHISRDEKCVALANAGFPEYAIKQISTDTNIWGREFEFGALDDPECIDVPDHLYLWTRHSVNYNAPARVSIAFENGRPTHLNHHLACGVELISELNWIVGRFGLGRYIGLEEIGSGAKVQEVREMPAASLLLDAYRRIESACMPYACIQQKMQIEQIWTREAVEGRWFGALRMACGAFIDCVAGGVTGEVEYELTPGRCNLKAVRATAPLYVRDRSVLE